MRAVKKIRIRDSRIYIFSVVAVLAIFFLSINSHTGRPAVATAETRFVEHSVSGLEIVPASCPSAPHYAGECSVTPPPPPPPPPPVTGNGCSLTANQYTVTAGTPMALSWVIDPFLMLRARGGIFGATIAGVISPTGTLVTTETGATTVTPAATTQYVLSGNVTSFFGFALPFSCSATVTAVCPVGTSGTPPSCVSSLCPAGQHTVGNVCICDATNLPADNNGQCTGQVCPQGFQWDPGTNKCIAINQCQLPPICSDTTHVLNQCTGAVTNCAANGQGWICQNGACVKLPPPIASIITSAKLVPQGTVVDVTWTSQNTTSCSVTGNNGDGPWGGTAGSHASAPINSQTVFTLTCQGIDGTTLTKSTTVNIIPVFIET